MRKFVWLFLAMLLALVPVSSVFAQDAPPVLCTGLGDDEVPMKIAKIVQF